MKFRFNLPFVLFSPDGDGAAGGGAGNETPPKSPPAPPTPPAGDAAAAAALSAANAALAAAKAELAELLKKVPSEAESAEITKLRDEAKKRAEAEAQAEQKRKIEEGKFQEIIKDNEAKFAQEKSELQKQAEAVKARFHDTLISNVIQREVPKHTAVDPEMVHRAILAGRLGVVEKNGVSEVVVLPDASGRPALNDQGKPQSVAEFIAKAISGVEWIAGHKPKGGSGSPERSGAADGVQTDEDIAKMSTNDVLNLIGRGRK